MKIEHFAMRHVENMEETADKRLFSPIGVVAMGNALSAQISRPNLYLDGSIYLNQSFSSTGTGCCRTAYLTAYAENLYF